jgi:hypothetical protein
MGSSNTFTVRSDEEGREIRRKDEACPNHVTSTPPSPTSLSLPLSVSQAGETTLSWRAWACVWREELVRERGKGAESSSDQVGGREEGHGLRNEEQVELAWWAGRTGGEGGDMSRGGR